MNTEILKKILAELKSPAPRLAYIEGMLETLIEVTDKESAKYTDQKYVTTTLPMTGSVNTTNDEAAIMEAKARAALASVKAMSEASSHEV